MPDRDLDKHVHPTEWAIILSDWKRSSRTAHGSLHPRRPHRRTRARQGDRRLPKEELMQDLPVCFKCHKRVESEPIFEAPCGHDTCASAVFHGLCLMEYRDQRAQALEKFEVVGLLVRPWMQEHTENG